MGTIRLFLLALLIRSTLVEVSGTSTVATPTSPTPTTSAATTSPTPTTSAATTTSPTPTTRAATTTSPTPSTTTAGISPAPSTSAEPTTSPTPSTTSAEPTTSPTPSTTTAVTTTSPAPSTAAATTTSPTPSTDPVKDPCDPNPCPKNSKCEEIADKKHRCVCDAGFNYNEITEECEKAKVFPGDLTVTGTPYVPEMANTASAAFQKTSTEIVTKLNIAFEKTAGYISSVVISLKPPSTAVKVLHRTTGTDVVAEVDNIFKIGSNVTEEQVTTAADTVGEYKVADPCQRASMPCDVVTTKECDWKQIGGFRCTCRDKLGWIKANNFKSCGVCASGKEAVKSVCEDCPFGYTGFNCGDKYLLIVVAVSSVLGVLLVVSMSVTTYSILGKSKLKKGKKEKKDKSKNNNIGLTYRNSANDDKPSFTIPRVGGGTDMGNNHNRPNANVNRAANMNGVRTNTPPGMQSKGGGMRGYRAQTGPGP